MPGGQSGQPLSPFFLAGHEVWVRGERTPFLPGPAVHHSGSRAVSLDESPWPSGTVLRRWSASDSEAWRGPGLWELGARTNVPYWPTASLADIQPERNLSRHRLPNSARTEPAAALNTEEEQALKALKATGLCGGAEGEVLRYVLFSWWIERFMQGPKRFDDLNA